MCQRRSSTPIIVLALTSMLATNWAATSRVQLLKSSKTAPAPELRNVTQWINSEPLTMKKLRGKVGVVDFWTNGCFNCKNNYPHYKAWQERYACKDVVILGIHTPETTGERDIERIGKQADKNGLKFPIAVDNDGANWNAWNNRVWPTVYVVIFVRGIVRYGWEGELSWRRVRPGEEKVRKLVDELLLECP